MNPPIRPQVSVVVPLFNKAPYISRALDSIFGQTFKDFEVIVVDDGSTDNGPDIVRRYTDQRLRMISQPNAGPGSARNHGLRESRFPLVAFLDADDEWFPEFLSRSTTGLSLHPDCALVITGFREGAQQIDKKPFLQNLGITEGRWVITPDIHPLRLKRILDSFNPSMIVGKKDILEGYGGFYAGNCCTFGEDTYLWLQIFFNHAIYRTTESLVWFHTEASDLDFNRKSEFPLKPILTDPTHLYETCPPAYRGLLDRCLAGYALSAMKVKFRTGDTAGAARMVSDFPRIKEMGWNYYRLKTEMALHPIFKRIRSNSLLHLWARKLKSAVLPSRE